MFQKFLNRAIKFPLFLTALTPLIISQSTIFPFILGKTLFFRSIIEIALILFLVYLSVKAIRVNRFKSALIGAVKNPLIVFLALFFISLALSVIFAENNYRAFWGDLERGEGLFGMLHALVFMLIAVVIFKKNDWLNYFKISLIVGFIVVFYAFLQYFGVRNFPFALMPEARPVSYIGNAAFLATHMFFLMMFAAIVFFNTSKFLDLKPLKTFRFLYWRCFSLLMSIAAAAAVFISGTRGAILGLGAGIIALFIYFIFQKQSISVKLREFPPVSLRQISAFFLAFLIIFSGIFWLTRENIFWQKIPGLNRLAKTAAFDINDASTQFRLITWKLSWKAFKEKPLFGWGPENYIVAYEKYYDPEYAVYGESWLDRAHNKIIDAAVMQGVFGLIAYLGIFGAVFYLLIKNPLIYSKFLMAGLIGYFIQNLFVFDQVISYGAFFAVLGYIISNNGSQFQETQAFEINRRYLGFYFIAAILIVALGYSLYFYNLVPYIQARLFKASSGVSHNAYEVAAALKRAMYPYNFAQFNIRSTGVDIVYLDQFFYNASYVSNPKFKPLGDLLIEGIDELAKKEPYDIRVLIREVEMLNGITKVVDEENAKPLFEKAEKLMREAVKRAPNRQEVYYHLAFNLAGQKRYEESFEAARRAISLNPKVARAHFHLALVLAIADKNKEAADVLKKVVELDPDLNTLMSGDQNTVLLIYNLAGQKEKSAGFIVKSLNKEIGVIFEKQYYEEALRYFAARKDADNFIKVANYLKQFDDLKDDMEVLIDLAKKGMWGIINSL